MTKFLRRLCAFALVFCTAVLQAQTGDFVSLLQSGPVELSYNFKGEGDNPFCGSGHLVYSGGCFRAEGNGVEIYCDTHNIWTVDPDSKEVYIESAEAANHFLANPETLVARVSDFSVSGNSATGRYTNPSDGRTYAFRLTGISRPSSLPSSWSFGSQGLDKTWVITDLR